VSPWQPCTACGRLIYNPAGDWACRECRAPPYGAAVVAACEALKSALEKEER